MTDADRPIVLAAGDALVAVDPGIGGRLTSMVVAGEERLVGSPAPGDRSIRWGSFLMAPWVGRMAGANLDWQGRRHRFAATLGRHAIHGLVFDRPWRTVESDAARVRLEIDLGVVGWPFGGLVRQAIRLFPDRLELEAEIEADGSSMPAAIGWHPWFGRPRSGDMAVRLEAGATLDTDPDLIPTGRLNPVDAESDLRRGPALGDRRLDHVYPATASPVVLSWPDLALTMTFGPPISTFVVHSPPSGVCVEPQTSIPDAASALARGETDSGLVTLGAGESLRAGTVWHWKAATRPGEISDP